MCVPCGNVSGGRNLERWKVVPLEGASPGLQSGDLSFYILKGDSRSLLFAPVGRTILFRFQNLNLETNLSSRPDRSGVEGPAVSFPLREFFRILQSPIPPRTLVRGPCRPLGRTGLSPAVTRQRQAQSLYEHCDGCVTQSLAGVLLALRVFFARTIVTSRLLKAETAPGLLEYQQVYTKFLDFFNSPHAKLLRKPRPDGFALLGSLYRQSCVACTGPRAINR